MRTYGSEISLNHSWNLCLRGSYTTGTHVVHQSWFRSSILNCNRSTYFSERFLVSVRPISESAIRLGHRGQFGVWLNAAGAHGNSGGLFDHFVWWVEVMVPLVQHQLLLLLCYISRIWDQSMGQNALYFYL